jgi:hypothetical protein
MTNLEQFLNKKMNTSNISVNEPASGSFTCQHEDCDEVINDGFIDRVNNRIHWICVHGHESSVII